MRLSRIVLALMVLLLCAAPSMADGKAIGIPDAPPVERVVARQDGLEIPGGFDVLGGRSFPGGSYDLALIECAGHFYLQLTHQDSRRGVRVPVDVKAASKSAESSRALRFGRESQSIQLKVGDLLTTFALEPPRTAG